MSNPTLRALTIRLASMKAGLRPDLLRVLQASGNTSVVQQPPIVITQPPIIVQQEAAPVAAPIAAPAPVMPVMMPMMPPAPMAVAPNLAPTAPVPVPVPVIPPAQAVTQVPEQAPVPAPVGAIFVTERTQKGFEADLIPEMERSLSSGVPRDQVAQQFIGLIQQAFKEKTHLYNILIRHQATFEGDVEYRESLERLVQAWVTDTADSGV